MRKYIKTQYIPLYFILVLIFRYLFVLIPPLVIRDLVRTPYVIDVDVFERWALFNTDYIVLAKDTYNCTGYQSVYLPLDLVFPVVYSFLFASIACFTAGIPRLHRTIGILILSGAIADYGENISFAVYLGSCCHGLALPVAVLSAIKTMLFIANGVAAIVTFVVAGIRSLVSRSIREA